MVSLDEALLELKSPAEAQALLNLLFTPTELNEISNRWFGCQMAFAGVTQRKISAETGVSGTTAARCARAVREARSDFAVLANRLGITSQISLSRKSP